MNIDRRLLDVKFTISGIADKPETNPTAGTQYIVGSTPTGAFAGAPANSLAYYDGSAWKFIVPKAEKLEVFNASTNEILSFNGSHWITVASLDKKRSNDYHRVLTLYHTITDEEIQNKSFVIEYDSSLAYRLNRLALFLNGVLQRYDTDYISTADDGKSFHMEWGPGFNALDIRAGDIIMVLVQVVMN